MLLGFIQLVKRRRDAELPETSPLAELRIRDASAEEQWNEIVDTERRLAEEAYRSIAVMTGDEPGRFDVVVKAMEQGPDAADEFAREAKRYLLDDGDLGSALFIAALDEGLLRVHTTYPPPESFDFFYRGDDPVKRFSRWMLAEHLQPNEDRISWDDFTALRQYLIYLWRGNMFEVEDAPLRPLLERLDLNIHAMRGSGEPTRPRNDTVLAGIGSVKFEGQRGDLLITPLGHVFLPDRMTFFGEKRVKNLVYRSRVEDLANRPSAVWIPRSATIHGSSRSLDLVGDLINAGFQFRNLSLKRVTWTDESGRQRTLKICATADETIGASKYLQGSLERYKGFKPS